MRVLIIGGDGLIGEALASVLRQRGHDVIATTRRVDRVEPYRVVHLDLAAAKLAPVPDADVMVLCAAVAKFADCRQHPELAQRVNVGARLELARAMQTRGGRTIALSSSVVFDGSRPFARAEWPPAPRSAYGRMLAQAEAGVLGHGGTIFRLTKVITQGSGVLREWIGALRRGLSVRAFEDHTFCPLPLADVVDGLVGVVEQPEGGIFQISGASDLSYAGAARHLLHRIGVPSDRVVAVRAADRGIPESEVTPFTSLDTSRLSAQTGFRPPQPTDVIDAVFGRMLASCEARIDA
jgi:dTDP-4-dehydrorhamnose reductase